MPTEFAPLTSWWIGSLAAELLSGRYAEIKTFLVYSSKFLRSIEHHQVSQDDFQIVDGKVVAVEYPRQDIASQ
jgi:hypothetical protein